MLENHGPKYCISLMFLSVLLIKNSLCMFFINFHSVAPILNRFGMMVGDLIVKVLDTHRCASVNSKPNYFPHYFCKKSTGVVTAVGAEDTRENPTIYMCTVPVLWGESQTIFCHLWGMEGNANYFMPLLEYRINLRLSSAIASVLHYIMVSEYISEKGATVRWTLLSGR